MGYDAPDIQGWMSPNELNWLYERAKEMESVVEIGCWKGKSTHALLSGCPGPVFAVDHFQGNSDELKGQHAEATRHDIGEDFKRNVGHFPNLVLMRMASIGASKFFKDKSINMVFIDGCHIKEEVKADIQAWMPVCRRLLCGHDFSVIKEALTDMNLNFKTEVGTIWSVVP